MAPCRSLPFALALLITFLIIAHAERLSLPPGWSFSKDLSFPSPSSSSSSSSLNSYSDIAPFSLFLSILSSTSFDAGSKGFSLGFLSLFDSSASSPTRIYLCICLGVSKNGPSSGPFLVPVWNFNDTSPLQQQGQLGLVKLEVNDNNELRLEDGDGRVVWRMSNVESMEMQEDGNLVIYDPTNKTVWQSFDHPSNALVKGQQFNLSMELTSSNQMYKMVMQPGGLLFYRVSSNPFPLAYWVYTGNFTVYDYFIYKLNFFDLDATSPINLTSFMDSPSCAQSNKTQAYALLEKDGLLVQDACGSLFKPFPMSLIADFVRLDADGGIRDYQLQQSYLSNNLTSPNADNKGCSTPNVCGAYGICTVVSTNIPRLCRCPSEIDNQNLRSTFSFIDASNPSQGCERTETLECKPNSTQALVEIKRVASRAMLYFFERTWKENSIPLEDCKAACSSSCSCTGFFYHTKSSFCLPFGDNTSISNLSFITLSSDDHVAYLKIQLKSSPSHDNKLLPLPIIVVAVVFIALILIAAVVVVVYKTTHPECDPECRLAEQQLLGVMPTLPTRFSYLELSRCTEGFSRPLGSGGFGSVYAGVLPDGRRVAVKKLQRLSHGQKEFLAEIATIGGVSHVNIVGLYGFCLEKQHRLLVYEYMENGSLDNWLFCKEGKQELQVMSWERRFNVALCAARGLAFLHEECPKPILHFDVKPQNILLDGEFSAKLADFGLSKLVTNGQSSVTTLVRGTPGYIAPEWVSHSIVSKKCDVYSFGMVLLELVSGRKNVEIMELEGSEEWYFPKWAAKKSREGKVEELVDKRLVKKINEDNMGVVIEENMLEQVKRVLGVALMCIHEKPEMRPSMMGACSMLEGSVALPTDNIILLIGDTAPPPSSTLTCSATIGSISTIEPR